MLGMVFKMIEPDFKIAEHGGILMLVTLITE
jgi:hypothetical protein